MSYSAQQVQELQQQLETAITERSQAAAELAAAATAAADAQGQLASLRQQAAGREQQIKEAADKVSRHQGCRQGLSGNSQAACVAKTCCLIGVDSFEGCLRCPG